MAFKKPTKKPDFSVLKKTLAQSKNNLDNATYQTIQQIIEKLIQLQLTDAEEKAEINKSIDTIVTTPAPIPPVTTPDLSPLSFLTASDETANLPNSIVLLAGTNITFDDTVPNQRTINASGSGSSENGYYAPMTDGDPDETELIFADGECVMVFIPTP